MIFQNGGYMHSTSSEALPSALENALRIKEKSRGRSIIFFLDYDGTLTPIVERPEDAWLSDSMKAALEALMTQYQVAIISGRDLVDVQNLVGLKGLLYAASHGFDIHGPNISFELSQAVALLPKFDELEKKLHEALDGISGVQIERKRFSIATHYRRVSEDEQDTVKNTVKKLAQSSTDFKIGHGKKVLECRPNLDWDKGRALLWLKNVLQKSPNDTFCIYIGDDITG
jgi:trehalose 6-phosphate phosphatase